MTTTYPEGARGLEVQEADIELNSAAFQFQGQPGASTDGGARTLQLRPVLLHEIGHVLGLEDACIVGRRPSGAPDRADCPFGERQSVMAGSALLNAPAVADVQKLCALHPRASKQPGESEPKAGALTRQKGSGCGCEVGHTIASAGLALGAVVAVVGAAALRRSFCPRWTGEGQVARAEVTYRERWK